MIVFVVLSILLSDTVACIALSAVGIFLALCNIPGLCYSKANCGELCFHLECEGFLLGCGGFFLTVDVFIQIVENWVHYIGKPWWSSP